MVFRIAPLNHGMERSRVLFAMTRRATGVLLMLATLIVPAPARGEGVTLPRTDVVRVTAKSNQVPYKLYISLPTGYPGSDQRYPVIYLLDADYSFAIAHNVVEHLADRNHLRWAILVGIAYDGPSQYRLNRTRDYTPVHSPTGGYGAEMQKHSGGGTAFRDFLEKELIPSIDSKYRTSEERVLVGHSYGGLFATWMMLTRPGLFDGYVIVSPSLWYDEGMIFELEKKASAGKAALKGRAYLSAGASEAAVMPADLKRFAKTLRERNHSSLAIRDEVLDDETHNSIFPSAFSRGIRWVMRGR